MSRDTAAIRDQLGNDPDIIPILNADYDETVGIEEGPTIIKGNTLGNSWIVGTVTNGLVGTNTGTQGGGQQVVGEENRVMTIKRVVNPNNVFHEHFRDNEFEDTDVTTADWDTSAFEIGMTNTEIVQSKAIFLNSINIDNAKIILTLGSGALTDLTIQLSSDGGSNFETVTNNTLYSFTNVGQELKFKITATDTVDITEIKIEYNKG